MSRVLYVGMDVHSTSFSLATFALGEVEFVCGKEAGCLGDTLSHLLTAKGIRCVIVASTTILESRSKRGEAMTVRNIFAETGDKLRAEGRAEGFLHALFSLVQDGMLPIAAAAAKANMSETDFRTRMQETEALKG